MPTARADQVDLSATPYYHCMARCVRRAYLCGKDAYSGKNFEHRRDWVRERLRFLAGVFAIDVCAYAIMSNHLHVVLHVDSARAAAWSPAEVVKRYTKLYPTAKIDYDTLPADKQRLQRKKWRSRLFDLSWMMRALNERIARRANQEDELSGRFWEGRFKSQALLDERGVLTCMAYVDLNPVRAGMARTLKGSDFTSVQERITLASKHKHRRKRAAAAPPTLAPFVGQESDSCATIELPAMLDAYIELLEWTGQQLAKGKRGTLTSSPPPRLLTKHGLSAERWVASLGEHKIGRVTFLGKVSSIEKLAKQRGKAWLRGLGLARRCTA